MHTIINGIFSENGFEIDKSTSFEVQNIEFWRPIEKKQKLEAFFIVFYIADLKLLNLDYIREVCFNYYQELGQAETAGSALEKNTYVIVCLKTNATPVSQEIMKKIFDIEEDPLYSKNMY